MVGRQPTMRTSNTTQLRMSVPNGAPRSAGGGLAGFVSSG